MTFTRFMYQYTCLFILMARFHCWDCCVNLPNLLMLLLWLCFSFLFVMLQLFASLCGVTISEWDCTMASSSLIWMLGTGNHTETIKHFPLCKRLPPFFFPFAWAVSSHEWKYDDILFLLYSHPLTFSLPVRLNLKTTRSLQMWPCETWSGWIHLAWEDLEEWSWYVCAV